MPEHAERVRVRFFAHTHLVKRWVPDAGAYTRIELLINECGPDCSDIPTSVRGGRLMLKPAEFPAGFSGFPGRLQHQQPTSHEVGMTAA